VSCEDLNLRRFFDVSNAPVISRIEQSAEGLTHKLIQDLQNSEPNLIDLASMAIEMSSMLAIFQVPGDRGELTSIQENHSL